MKKAANLAGFVAFLLTSSAGTFTIGQSNLSESSR